MPPDGIPRVGEADVVGPTVERPTRALEALRAEPVVEDLLDLARALRPGGVARGGVAVAVVDPADVVGRREHVVVEHHVDLVDLALAEVLGVVGRADQAVLLGAEPHEADLVAELVVPVGHLLGLGEQRRRAGAVVVDARTRRHGVEVRADHDDVVGVAATRLRDHLRQEAVGEVPVDLEVHGRVLALLVGLEQLVAEGVAGDHRGDGRRRVGLVVDEDRVLPRRACCPRCR